MPAPDEFASEENTTENHESSGNNTGSPEEATTEKNTEPETDEYGNVIEPDTGLYIPEDLNDMN